MIQVAYIELQRAAAGSCRAQYVGIRSLSYRILRYYMQYGRSRFFSPVSHHACLFLSMQNHETAIERMDRAVAQLEASPSGGSAWLGESCAVKAIGISMDLWYIMNQLLCRGSEGVRLLYCGAGADHRQTAGGQTQHGKQGSASGGL